MKNFLLGNNIRNEFPIFLNDNKKRLSFLDSAASTQKPLVVIDGIANFYKKEYANVHRGAYDLSAKASKKYEDARKYIKDFLNAQSPDEIIFTRGTTESINLVSYSIEDYFKEGDTILISIAEHHSNLVTWQALSERKKLNLQYVFLDENLNLDLKDYEEKLKEFRPKLVAMTMLSNVLGSEFPVYDIVEMAKKYNALVLLDGAQYVPHKKTDVFKLNADFVAFSGHKMYGPTGIGVLYAKKEVQNIMKPFQYGGEMIEHVTMEKTTFAKSPQKFEAGTPQIAQAIAMIDTVKFIEKYGMENIEEHEKNIFEYAYEKLKSQNDVTMYLPKNDLSKSSSVISFNIQGVHPHDFASIADSFGVQIRSGFHCAMPLLNYLGTYATNRISFGIYSDKDDIDALMLAIEKARGIFSKK